MAASESELRTVFSTSFAEDVYVPKDSPVCTVASDESGTEEGISADTAFFDVVMPFFWYSMAPHKFVSSGSSKNGRIFKAPGNCDMLLYSYLVFETPELRVKKEHVDNYRIAFTRYLGVNVAPKARFLIGKGEALSAVDKYYNWYYINYHSQPGHQKSYARRAGRVDSLTKWTTHLLPHELTPKQPWWYGMRSWSAFPLYKIRQEDKPVHEYEFNLNILSHLRMKHFDGRKWVSIRPDPNVLDGFPMKAKLATPELYGMFAMITPHEKEKIHRAKTVYSVDSVVDLSKESTYGSGKVPRCQIKTNGQLAKVLYWCAENRESVSLNDHFNFTTNVDDPKNGSSAIVKNDFLYGTTPKFSKMSMSHFNGPLTDEHFLSSPLDPGSAAYSFTQSGSRPESSVGIFPDALDAKLLCELSSPGGAEYTLKVHVSVTRRIEISERRFRIMDGPTSVAAEDEER